MEINARVNYPIKTCLIALQENGDIDLDSPQHKFGISWFTIRVAAVGTTLAVQSWNAHPIQWTLANPNSLGPQPIQISEIFGLVKATAATCVIVAAPYLHSVLGSLGSLPLLHVHRTHNTAPTPSFSTLLIHLTSKT